MSGMSRHTKTFSRTSVASKPPLYIYYCLCGEFVLVSNTTLESLPRRPLDGSFVLRCFDSPKQENGERIVAPIYKISASQGLGQILERYVAFLLFLHRSPDGSVERQYEFRCTRCQLPIGYEHTPPPLKSGGAFTFLLPGALTYVSLSRIHIQAKTGQGTL